MTKRLCAAWFTALCLAGLAPGAAAREQAAAVAAISGSEPQHRREPFVERFQAPDLGPRWFISHGWTAGEWSSTEWRNTQVARSPFGAQITMLPSEAGASQPYIAGEISTPEEYLYGYFEARLRVPHGGGLVGAFFTFTRPNGNETWNEIDMEFTGRDTRRLELVYHVAGQATLEVAELPFDASEDFHTYAFEWRPDAIRWFIDNELVHTSRGGLVSGLNRPQRIFASLWNSERMPRWLGPIDRAEAPWVMDVVCIAYAPTYEGRSICID